MPQKSPVNISVIIKGIKYDNLRHRTTLLYTIHALECIYHHSLSVYIHQAGVYIACILAYFIKFQEWTLPSVDPGVLLYPGRSRPWLAYWSRCYYTQDDQGSGSPSGRYYSSQDDQGQHSSIEWSRYTIISKLIKANTERLVQLWYYTQDSQGQNSSIDLDIIIIPRNYTREKKQNIHIKNGLFPKKKKNSFHNFSEKVARYWSGAIEGASQYY